MITRARIWIKPVGWVVFSIVILCAVYQAKAASLTAAEINQIETDLNITLTASNITELSAVVFPTNSAWRTAAYDRIDTHRKADLDIQVVDMNGDPVEGAQVAIKLKSNDFKFGGVFNLKDFTDEDNNLSNNGLTEQEYRDLLLAMFNSVGLDNGFKPKQRSGNAPLIPNFLSWAQSNDMPVRGHLLIWPGNDSNNHMPTELPDTATSYSILSKVEAAEADPGNTNLLADLKSEVDYMIGDWASKWSVYEWDVINETLSNHRVQDLLGYEETAEWFKVAESNVVDPDCKLLINEFQIISARSAGLSPTHYTDRRDAYYESIDYVIDNGGRLDRIGFQSRVKFEVPNPQTWYDRLDEFATAYSLPMVGTEFEVRDTNPDNPLWFPYDYTEKERAEVTESLLTAYYSHPLTTGLNAWTFMKDELYSMCYYDGTVKLNGLAWYYLHRIRYNTDATLAANVSGETGLRAFKGEYDITVTYDGVDYPVDLTLSNDQSVVISLSGVTVPTNEVNLVDAWYYDGLTNGSALSDGISTGLVGGAGFNDDDLAVIENQAVRWMADGVDESAFRTAIPSSSLGVTNGRYQLSVDYLDADFTGSAAETNGDARVGFGIRSYAATTNDLSWRLRFVSGGGTNAYYQLQVTDAAAVNQTVATFPGATLEHLNIRSVLDLDNRGSSGSVELYYSLNGAGEVAAYTDGELASDFELDEIRIVVQTINGGANWVPGDKVYTDNLMLASLGEAPEPPPPPVRTVLEEWTMTGGADGARLNTVPSTTGTGSTLSGTQANGQDIQGEQIRIFSAGTGAGFGNINDASYAGATSGVYEISFDITAADLSLTSLSNGSAQAGFGFRFNDGSNRDLRTLFRYNGAAASDEFRLVVSTAGDGNQNITIETGSVLSALLNVRQVLDMDAGTYSVYYTLGAAAEVEAYSGGVFAGQTIDSMRQQFQALNGGNSMQVGDAIYMDDINLYLVVEESITPESLLADWLADYPTLGSATNLTDNPDLDIANNLLEYAFGGDPTNGLDIGTWPTDSIIEAGGTNYIEYVYAKRNDAMERGLGYTLENTQDLIGGTWTNTGFVFVGEGGLDGEFDTVTNRLPAIEDAGFIRVKIDFTP